jgi:hypothetical protein
VPASITTAVKYRVRLYDSASAPSVAAWGGATGGEVEDGTAPCVTPASVTGASLTDLGGNQLQLNWAPAAGAAKYEVWWSTSAPYFVPDAALCPRESLNCKTAPGTSFLHDAAPAGNLTYIVRAVSGCDRVSTSYPRIGRFNFVLIPGN